jgi:hypothetical protein
MYNLTPLFDQSTVKQVLQYVLIHLNTTAYTVLMQLVKCAVRVYV